MTNNRPQKRGFILFCVFFLVVSALLSTITMRSAGVRVKRQMAEKCASVAGVVAAVIEKDPDAYTEFVRTLDTSSAYYQETAALIRAILLSDVQFYQFLYTEIQRDDKTAVLLFGGNALEAILLPAPGDVVEIHPPRRIAYQTRAITLGDKFYQTAHGNLMSSYVPIVNKKTGAFLGLAGCDVSKAQYNATMSSIFLDVAALNVLVFSLLGVTILFWGKQLRLAHTTDKMTGLGNKSHFFSVLHKRHGEPNLYVIMADLDHFKRINDTYGHPFGDVVLLQFADIFRKNLRESDSPSRYGGEEFIALFCAESAEQACVVAERIRRAVEDAVFQEGETSVKVTVSIGIAPVHKSITAAKAMKHADEALYQAKTTRNTVVMYNSTDG